jgi:hypothetical protein
MLHFKSTIRFRSRRFTAEAVPSLQRNGAAIEITDELQAREAGLHNQLEEAVSENRRFSQTNQTPSGTGKNFALVSRVACVINACKRTPGGPPANGPGRKTGA